MFTLMINVYNAFNAFVLPRCFFPLDRFFPVFTIRFAAAVFLFIATNEQTSGTIIIMLLQCNLNKLL